MFSLCRGVVISVDSSAEMLSDDRKSADVAVPGGKGFVYFIVTTSITLIKEYDLNICRQTLRCGSFMFTKYTYFKSLSLVIELSNYWYCVSFTKESVKPTPKTENDNI